MPSPLTVAPRTPPRRGEAVLKQKPGCHAGGWRRGGGGGGAGECGGGGEVRPSVAEVPEAIRRPGLRGPGGERGLGRGGGHAGRGLLLAEGGQSGGGGGSDYLSPVTSTVVARAVDPTP